MKLVSFSLQNFRSIQKAEKIALNSMTILVGPNNEGKSNILRGLVAGMEILAMSPVRTIRPGGGGIIERYRVNSLRGRDLFDWERDFPISLQAKRANGLTVFDFEFELSQVEVEEFKHEVKSNLNGSLPIRLSIGADNIGKFEVRKKGPGAATLTKKRAAIARFVSTHLNVKDIPAVRTASSAMQLIDEMVARELKQLERSQEYQEAVKIIGALQKPILDTLSATVRSMLATFLPDVKHVQVEVSDRYGALRKNTQIVVDDGTATELRYKGDGVQSLAAISLIHHLAAEQSASESELVLAIEEPEAHLHPRAVHQLKQVLQEIASRQQVVLTTHSPLLVNRSDISSNVIVDKNRARKARSIQEIRDALGVRVSDSLSTAELVLVVEGESDRRSLLALLPSQSRFISQAMESNRLAIESLHGASNLSYKLSQIRDQLCISHTFLDHDAAAVRASEKATSEGLLTAADQTFATTLGMRESELEDLYEMSLYSDMILRRYNVDLASDKQFKKKQKKWTERIAASFQSSGQLWSDLVCKRVKTQVADLVVNDPSGALNTSTSQAIQRLVAAIEGKLSQRPGNSGR